MRRGGVAQNRARGGGAAGAEFAATPACSFHVVDKHKAPGMPNWLPSPVMTSHLLLSRVEPLNSSRHRGSSRSHQLAGGRGCACGQGDEGAECCSRCSQQAAANAQASQGRCSQQASRCSPCGDLPARIWPCGGRRRERRRRRPSAAAGPGEARRQPARCRSWPQGREGPGGRRGRVRGVVASAWRQMRIPLVAWLCRRATTARVFQARSSRGNPKDAEPEAGAKLGSSGLGATRSPPGSKEMQRK